MMLATASLGFLLASVALATQDLNEEITRCKLAEAFEKQGRCLIQRERLEKAALLQHITLSNTEVREMWPHEQIIIDFTAGSSDMSNVQKLTMPNFEYDGASVVNVSKEYLELSFTSQHPAGAYDTVKNKARLYGFTNKTGGISNVKQKRFWSKKPNAPGAELFYGIAVVDVPGHAEWNYTITFAQTPPSNLKVEPSTGTAYHAGQNIWINLRCDTPDGCEDDSILISQVKFSPWGGYMPDLEDPVDLG